MKHQSQKTHTECNLESIRGKLVSLICDVDDALEDLARLENIKLKEKLKEKFKKNTECQKLTEN